MKWTITISATGFAWFATVYFSIFRSLSELLTSVV